MPRETLCKSAILWIKEKAEKEDILLHYLDLLEYHEQKLKYIEAKIKHLADENKEVQLLITILGIAEVRAMDIVAEIGEIKRFPTADKLCSYAGLVPSIRQSGDNLQFGRLIRQASRALKTTLIETCWNLVRTRASNPLQEFYKKLCKKKNKQKAICATARKLCCIIHAMLRKGEEFRYS